MDCMFVKQVIFRIYLGNYRLISLATIIEVLDRTLDIHLTKPLQVHDGQFGFWPGLSAESGTSTQLGIMSIDRRQFMLAF